MVFCLGSEPDVPCQTFLRLIAKLGSVTYTLTITGKYAYANNFEVRLKALTDLAINQRLGGTTLIL